jgi:hypothetical protein
MYDRFVVHYRRVRSQHSCCRAHDPLLVRVARCLRQSQLTFGDACTGRNGDDKQNNSADEGSVVGLLGRKQSNGYEVKSVWMIASDALAATFALNPIEVRDFLDGDAGRLLADDIGFIEGGPTNAAAIETLINVRLCHLGWQRLYQHAISQIRGCRQSGHAQPVRG